MMTPIIALDQVNEILSILILFLSGVLCLSIVVWIVNILERKIEPTKTCDSCSNACSCIFIYPVHENDIEKQNCILWSVKPDKIAESKIDVKG